jgi:hypothetical protein
MPVLAIEGKAKASTSTAGASKVSPFNATFRQG